MSKAFNFPALTKRIGATLDKDLFFIGGTIKSGTTWLQLILDGHPEIACRGEGHFVTYLSKSLKHAVDDYNDRITAKNNKIFSELEGFPVLEQDHLLFLLVTAIGLQLSSYGCDQAIRAVGEKTPDNIRVFPQMHALFPGARFLHIVRDGRDVAISGWFHNQRVSPVWIKSQFSDLAAYVDRIAQDWVNEVQAGRQFGRMHPDNYLELRYEDLLHDGAASVERVLKFLGVDAGPDSVARCIEAGDFKRLSGGRKAGEEDRGSHFRKGVAGDWRNHFDADATAAFEKRAGDLLKDLGYA